MQLEIYDLTNSGSFWWECFKFTLDTIIKQGDTL